MIHRECGVLKTTYEADMGLYPLPIARYTVAALGVQPVAAGDPGPGRHPRAVHPPREGHHAEREGPHDGARRQGEGGVVHGRDGALRC